MAPCIMHQVIICELWGIHVHGYIVSSDYVGDAHECLNVVDSRRMFT